LAVGDEPQEIRRDCKRLQVWQKAHRFVLDVGRDTQGFPAEERFGLAAQLRRAAVSVADTVAQGPGRGAERELARYLSIAAGSASEAAYPTLMARDLGYLSTEASARLDAQANRIKKLLASILRTSNPRPTANS
jgi:four helix bundle protein